MIAYLNQAPTLDVLQAPKGHVFKMYWTTYS